MKVVTEFEIGQAVYFIGDFCIEASHVSNISVNTQFRWDSELAMEEGEVQALRIKPPEIRYQVTYFKKGEHSYTQKWMEGKHLYADRKELAEKILNGD